MIAALHHVQLSMPPGCEDQARAFYVSVLGFEEVEKPEILKARGGAWFRSRGAELHLGVENPFRPAKKAHPALRVASLNDTVTHLTKHEIAFVQDADLPAFRRIFIEDPFGNRIELLEVTP